MMVDFAWINENLYVAAVCDMLDSLGYRNQTLHQRLRPLDEQNCVFIGRAKTLQWMDANYIVEEDPYGLEIEAMDSLAAGDVVVQSTDNTGSNAPWGELMTTLAVMKGVVGCIVDSQIRDCLKIKQMKFPVFHAGIRPLDSKGRGRVMAFDVPVMCGGVLIHPGDMIFADFDGVVVIPKDAEEKIFSLAKEKVDVENITRKELLAGKSLREVFNKYGAL